MPLSQQSMMLHGRGNIEMDTTRGYVTNSLNYTRYVCPTRVSDTFWTWHDSMLEVSVLHVNHSKFHNQLF